MSIPGKNKVWAGQFPGFYSGNLWQTFNVNLERVQGSIALGDKMRRYVSGLGVVTKFIRTNATGTDQWFGLTSSDILRNGNSVITAGTWISDDVTNTFNDPVDGVIHESANGEERLIVTRDTKIAILNSSGSANIWDNDWGQAVVGLPDLTTSIPHPISRLQRLVAIGDKVSDVPVIHTIDKNSVGVASRLTFPTGYTVYSITSSSNRFWIGLRNDRDGHAKIIEWDGFSLTYNNEYDLVGAIPLVCFIVKNIPWYISNLGFVFQFTGYGFEKKQDFGLIEDNIRLFHSGADATTIAPYGALVDGERVYLNISAPTLASFNATVMPNGARRMRPGIWVLNTTNLNLYHYMGIGEHASTGTDVNYGGIMGAPGAVAMLEGTTRSLIASASVYVGGATWQAAQANGIYLQIPNISQASNAGRNRGYFITPRIPIEEAEGMWEALWLKFKRFSDSSARIVVKWRVLPPLFNATAVDQGSNPLEIMNAPATWVNTTSFTCKVPVGIAVGDEVEILAGDNAGCSFAISTLSGTPDNSTSLTVTIAEAAPTSSTDTFVCRFDNWKTETAISSTTIGNTKVPFTAQAHGEYIQFKIEMRGMDVVIDEIDPLIRSKTSKKQG
jgi:hypothetical protein